ncbi:uncharacterized protein LOC127640215 [Xyrauchen texanus]|uniref:uncharacterized protein LOC127640215 n=1 Tax=Xyrauchen texanus TaxID=154827 RepID=UPI0022421021|nr:uncharacterized protein LOC127640215 [Xyrauchen texanus]
MAEPSKIFKGIMVTTTTCCSCNKENEAETEFLSVPLSIDVKGKCDVINDVKEWPNILTLQLKRFEMMYSKTVFYYWKNECKVQISSTIQLDSVKYGTSPKYELYVIINHHGSYASGHYDALIKDDSENWYHFNDSSVQKMHRIDIRDRSQSAYLLMYRTVEDMNDDLKAKESATADYGLLTNTNEGKRIFSMLDKTKKKDHERKNNPGQAQGDKSKESGQARNEATQTTSPLSNHQCSNSGMQNNTPVSVTFSKTLKQKLKEEFQYLNEGIIPGRRQLKDIFIEPYITKCEQEINVCAEVHTGLG